MSTQELLVSSTAAIRMGLAKQTLARWRVEGKGPPFIKLSGNRVAYRASDVDAWLDNRLVHSTSEKIR